VAKRVVNFVLNSEADRDIVRWLDRQDNKSAAIREAIREHIGGTGVTLGDIYEAIKDLERRLQVGQVVTHSSDPGLLCNMELDEPPEAAAALDALANL
jgi:hypothetical protein